MHHVAYAEIEFARIAGSLERKKQVVTRAIDLLLEAQKAGPRSREGNEAALFLLQSWNELVRDAPASEELRDDAGSGLRAFGEWMIAEAEKLRSGDFENLNSVIRASRQLKADLWNTPPTS